MAEKRARLKPASNTFFVSEQRKPLHSSSILPCRNTALPRPCPWLAQKGNRRCLPVVWREPRRRTAASFPDRGPWGDPGYRGNCSGYIYRQIFEFLHPHVFIDLMIYSGNVGEQGALF
jgi:hypothetical protein